MKYSVTGTIDVPIGTRLGQRNGYDIIRSVIAKLDDVTEFTTGGAFGADTIAAKAGVLYHPHARHRLCLPKGSWYNEFVISEAFDIERVEGGYMKRNDRLVYHCKVLLAFPKSDCELRRSGTWATIRRARKQRREVRIYPLDGSTPWIEKP